MSPKQAYLDYIRRTSAYPVYRGFINVIAMLGFILAGIEALGALGVFFYGMSSAGFLAGLMGLLVMGVNAVLTFLLARFFKEAANIIVDLGDSMLEVNSRGMQAQ